MLSADRDAEQLELSYAADGNENGLATLGKSWAVS